MCEVDGMNKDRKNEDVTVVRLLEAMGIEWTEEDKMFLTAIQDKEKRKIVISILAAT